MAPIFKLYRDVKKETTMNKTKENLELEKLELEVKKLKKDGTNKFITLSLAALGFAVSTWNWHNATLSTIINILILLLITLMAVYFMENLQKKIYNSTLAQKTISFAVIMWLYFSIFLFAYFLNHAIFPCFYKITL